MCERAADMLWENAGAWVLAVLPAENRVQHCRGKKERKRKRNEVIKVKWTEKRGEETELGELKEILKKMVKVMEWEGQEELIEQQRLMGLGVEKMLRVIEGKDWKWEEEREREQEKMKETEKVIEGEEENTDLEETEEAMVGEKDGDGE